MTNGSQGAQISMNDSRTCTECDTELTQPRSRSDRRARLLGLGEQLANYGREKDEGARERLRGFISQSILKLSQR
jgi:hypothetical protein